jgi:hypothetical protein
MRGTIAAMERTYTTPLLDKLGIRPGIRIAILGVDDPTFRALVEDRTGDITDGRPLEATNVVILGADSLPELDRLAELQDRLVPNGAIWVVSRKGREATLRDVDVIEAGRPVGLVDTKVVAFSSTHTALRLVILLAHRGR